MWIWCLEPSCCLHKSRHNQSRPTSDRSELSLIRSNTLVAWVAAARLAASRHTHHHLMTTLCRSPLRTRPLLAPARSKHSPVSPAGSREGGVLVQQLAYRRQHQALVARFDGAFRWQQIPGSLYHALLGPRWRRSRSGVVRGDDERTQCSADQPILPNQWTGPAVHYPLSSLLVVDIWQSNIASHHTADKSWNNLFIAGCRLRQMVQWNGSYSLFFQACLTTQAFQSNYHVPW